MTLITSFTKRSMRAFASIFRFSLRKNTGSLLLYGFLQMVLLPLILLIHLMNAVANHGMYSVTLDIYLPAAFSDCLRLLFPLGAVPLMLVFVIVFSIQLFRYMHGKRSVDLFHALPVGRTPLLLGKYCAGLFSLIVPFLCNILLCLLIGAFYGALGSSTTAFLLHYVLWFLLMTISCFTFAMLIAVCSGTTMEMMVSGTLISVSWPLAVLLVMLLIEELLPGYIPGYDITAITALSPVIAAFVPFAAPLLVLTGTDTISFWFTAWWIFLPVVMLVTAVFTYRRRKSEAAENPLSFPVLKILIRLVTTFAAGLGFGFLMYMFFGLEQSFFIGALAGSIAAHIVAEALYARGFKGMLKSFRWYAVPVVLFVVLYLSLSTGLFGYDIRIPPEEQIASAKISIPQNFYHAEVTDTEGYYYSYDYNQGSFSKEDGTLLTDLLPSTDDPVLLKMITTLHQTAVENNRSLSYPYRLGAFQPWSDTIEIEYSLKNGTVFSRRIPVSAGGRLYESLSTQARAIASDETFRRQSNLAYYLTPAYIESVELSGHWSAQTLRPRDEVLQDLLNALLADSNKFGYFEDETTAPESGPEGAETYADLQSYVTIILNLKDSFSPQEGSVLWTLAGGDPGPVSYTGGTAFTINARCTNTLAFLEDAGWDIASLNQPYS